MMKYIGWTKGNTVNFITATTLARHIVRSSRFKPKPFTFGATTIISQVRRHNPCYIIASLEGGEIDALLKMNITAVIIGKIHDKKYRIEEKQKIGNITIYPVLKTNKFKGFEYLATLTAYFNISNEEVRFFEVMVQKIGLLARTLTVTDAWIPAYDIFTTLEVIDDPNPNDIDRIIEYLKKSYKYDEIYAKMLEDVKNNVIFNHNAVVAIDLGRNDPRRYVVVAQEMYHNKKAVILVSRIPYTNMYKLLVLCNKRCNHIVKEKISNILEAECRGGTKKFTVRAKMTNNLKHIVEVITNILTQFTSSL